MTASPVRTTDMNAQQGARQVAQRMGEAATDFLTALSASQRAIAVLDFGDEKKRTFWHYTPIDRDGLPLTQMERPQQQLALKLAATGLSRAGYNTAATIMGLENVLDLKETWTRPLPGRDARLYYVRIFGAPGEKEPWGWSFEGHHLSLNYTLVGGRIVAPTPSFFGANPADSPLSDHHTLRPLAAIEDLARELMHSLDEGQRAAAILAAAAPPDIVLTNLPYIKAGEMLASRKELDGWRAEHGVHAHEVEALRYSSTPRGISSAALDASRREILSALVGEYIRKMPDELAEIEMTKMQQSGAPLHFGWAGPLERGKGHYYRIQGGTFLVEYDNTQNDANHIHSVWRDPQDDFGAGILARHYAHSH